MTYKKSWHQNSKVVTKARRTCPLTGEVFDSGGEYKRWRQLTLMQQAGKIRNLRRQITFNLVLPDGSPVLTQKGRVSEYTPDFIYDMFNEEAFEWVEVIEDFKGYLSRESWLRIAIFEAIYKKKVYLSGKGK